MRFLSLSPMQQKCKLAAITGRFEYDICCDVLLFPKNRSRVAYMFETSATSREKSRPNCTEIAASFAHAI